MANAGEHRRAPWFAGGFVYLVRSGVGCQGMSRVIEALSDSDTHPAKTPKSGEKNIRPQTYLISQSELCALAPLREIFLSFGLFN
jgi:hypothetical protein